MQLQSYIKIIDILSLLTISFAIFGVVFCPNNLLFTRVENFALIFAVILILFKEKLVIDKYLILILLSYSVIYWFSIAIVNKHPYNIWLYAIRPIKFLVFFILFSNVSISRHLNFNMFVRIIFIILAMINLIEILDIFSLRLPLFDFFSQRNIQEFWDHESWRIIGTMNNPNDNGVLLVCFMIYFLSGFHSQRNITDLLLMITCILLIVFAQSRTVLYVTIFVFVLYLVLTKLNRKTILYSILSLIFIIGIVYALDLNYVKDIFEKNPLDIPTLKGRLADWQISIDAWFQNKLFGAGYVPHGSYIYGADSEYFHSLAVSGILGTILYLAMIIYPCIRFWKHTKEVSYAMMPVLFTPSFLLIAITNVTLYDVRIGVLYFILLAIPFYYLTNQINAKQFITVNWRGWLKINIFK